MNSEGSAGTSNDADNLAMMREQFKRLQAKYETECVVRRDLLNQLIEVKGNIRVLARIRPLQPNEESSPLETTDEWTLHAPLSAQALNASSSAPSLTNSLSAPSLSAMLPTTSLLSNSGASAAPNASASSANASLLNKKFQFDRVFGPEATQADVYEEVSALPISLLDGYNCCLFAYGQTGSGKTFTMEGASADSQLDPKVLEDSRGLTYRILSYVFDEVENRPEMQYDMQVSVMEIYNEAIIDLLDMDLQTQTKFGASIASGGLKLRQGERGICVPDATRRTVKKWSEVEEAMEAAKRVRSVASTDMNEHSSRSHCVTCLEVCGRRSKNANPKSSNTAGSSDEVTHSRLFLIDLAGSERVAQSGAQGKAFDEAKHINKSLSALSRVMECLQQKRQHIPFRDSTLTHLLKDTLIDARTVMMLNLSPAASSYGQTVNSLNFGVRVRKIERAVAKRNFDLDRAAYNAKKTEMESEITTLKSEVQRLSALLSQAKSESNQHQQSINAKHMELITQLKQQITQSSIAHSAEIATLTSTHEREIAALKKTLAEAKLAAQAKSIETVLGPSLQKTTSLVLPRPTPTLIASSIVSQQLQPTATQKAKSEIDPETENQKNEVPVQTTAARDKYIHQTTPIKPKSVTSILSASITGSAHKKIDSPSSKLSSPIVVVDELQRLYLKHQREGTPNRSTYESEIPILDENGILLPVVMTPQVSSKRPTTMTTASPIGFTSLAPLDQNRPSCATSIFDDDGFLARPSVSKTQETPSVSPILPEIIVPAMPSGPQTSVQSNLPSNSATLRVSPIPAAKLPLKSILVPRGTIGRAKKKVTFCEAIDFLGNTDLKLAVRCIVPTSGGNSLPSNGGVTANSTNGTGLQASTSGFSAPVTSTQAASTKASTSNGGYSGAVRPTPNVGAQPASPIKSVAVRPTLSSSNAGASSSHSSSLHSNPGPRRVVAKHSTNLQVVPKATPARVRPVGRTTAPLAGAPTVYKTY
jgi:hypothetical protein